MVMERDMIREIQQWSRKRKEREERGNGDVKEKKEEIVKDPNMEKGI